MKKFIVIAFCLLMGINGCIPKAFRSLKMVNGLHSSETVLRVEAIIIRIFGCTT